MIENPDVIQEEHWFQYPASQDPDKGELVPWLMRQLTSVIDHLYFSQPHRYEVAILESEDGEELSNKIEYRASRASNSAATQPLDPEEIVLRKEEIEQRENALFQAVDGDPELEAILEAITSGCEPKARYLADELGVPVEDIYNRLRRLRRRASKLMKGENL